MKAGNGGSEERWRRFWGLAFVAIALEGDPASWQGSLRRTDRTAIVWVFLSV
jgi:hypothetical protein